MTDYPTIILTRINESFNLYEVYEDCFAPPFIVPKGFVTDFASIPRFLWSVLPPHGAAMPASVIHDFCYTTHPYGSTGSDMEIERVIADQQFKKNLIAAGISKFQAEIMYRAVRWFGAYRFKHFGKSRKTVRHERKIAINRQNKGI